METELLFYLAAVCAIAAFVHGSVGFGFPMLATPLFALVTDVQTAIMLTLIPNLLVNSVSILSEGHFLQAVKDHYKLVLLTAIGSAIGTGVLIYFHSEQFKLVLAMAILGYLLSEVFKLKIRWIHRYPKRSKIGFGLASGFMGGLTNVMAPILIIYYVETKQPKKVVIQSSNLCFLFGKLAQLSLFVVSGSFVETTMTVSGLMLLVVAVALPTGIYLRNRISEAQYKRALLGLLFVIAIVLVMQSLL